jgi:peptidoglycan hydrolase-like protein with peptidoglycan-binding domain
MDLTSEEESAYFADAMGDALGYGAASDYSNKPTLSQGSTDSAAVKELQRALMAKGYNLAPYNDDGDFGNATVAAVKKFQTASNLPATGVVSGSTWAMLLGTSKQDKQANTMNTIDNVMQGLMQGLTMFSPGQKQEYTPSDVPATTGQNYTPPPPGMSTGMKVGLGVVGLVVVGGSIYFIISRKR